MSASEIMALYKGNDSASANSTDSVHMEGKDSFTLKWMRTSPPTERVIETGESNKILGVLKVSVPYVLFRGLAMCAEVAKICNLSFIERSTWSYLRLLLYDQVPGYTSSRYSHHLTLNSEFNVLHVALYFVYTLFIAA
jgi:hypothetical protein